MSRTCEESRQTALCLQHSQHVQVLFIANVVDCTDSKDICSKLMKNYRMNRKVLLQINGVYEPVCTMQAF